MGSLADLYLSREVEWNVQVYSPMSFHLLVLRESSPMRNDMSECTVVNLPGAARHLTIDARKIALTFAHGPFREPPSKCHPRAPSIDLGGFLCGAVNPNEAIRLDAKVDP